MPASMPTSCVELLAEAVHFDTVNSRISGVAAVETPLAEYHESVAQQMGLNVQRLAIDGQSFNLLVACEVDPDAPWLLFDSHLDTVSVEGMSIDPFAATVTDGRMFGRGACDTKSSGAAMLWALGQYASQSDKTNNVAIVFTTDEELEKAGATAFVTKQLPTLGWRPAGVIVGEPTMLTPVIAHNGVVRWTIHTEGVAAHSSTPWLGRSAISMMVKVIDAIESRYIPSLDAEHELTGRAQCSVNVIHGGTQINIIPDHCTIQIDRRIVPDEDLESVIPAIDVLLDELRAADAAFSAVHENIYKDPPLDPIGSEAFAGVLGGVLDEMGIPAAPIGARYGTDASQYGSMAAIPTIVIGPGDIAQAHTHDEWIELDQVDKAVQVYLSLMRAEGL